MVFGVGTDIIEITRIKKAIEKNQGILKRLFTELEMEYYRKKLMSPQSIAAGFAAKEAVVKALGTGLRGIKWTDIEILRSNLGKPFVKLGNNAKDFADAKGIGVIHITLSHSKDFATATAIAETSAEREALVIEDLLLKSNQENRRNLH